MVKPWKFEPPKFLMYWFGANIAMGGLKAGKKLLFGADSQQTTYIGDRDNIVTYAPPSMTSSIISPHSYFSVLLLAFFFGIAGLHRFKVGRWPTGLLYLFSCGLFGIGAGWDVINIFRGRFVDVNGLPIKYVSNPMQSTTRV